MMVPGITVFSICSIFKMTLVFDIYLYMFVRPSTKGALNEKYITTHV